MTEAHALILAGGEGRRFAPLSTPDRPKPFLALVGETSLIQQTADRVRELVPIDQCWVAASTRCVPLVHQHLPQIPTDHIIGEVRKKNTAPAIALAAACIHHRAPDAVMVVLPSDHVITDLRQFHAGLRQAIPFAANHDALVTLGIAPTWPSPDYGYIERGIAEVPGVFRIRRFVEKPKVAQAESFLKAGTYSWNSGMFVWKASVILDNLEHFSPDLFHLLQYVVWEGDCPTADSVAAFFEAAPSISIDCGVMEKTDQGVVIPIDIGWSDVGTWASLKRLVDSGTVHVRSEIQTLIDQYAED